MREGHSTVIADTAIANSASIIIGLVFVIVASLLAYFFAPKGENQTYVLQPRNRG